MTFNKRKNSSRHRGSSSHGWGAKKRHRGAGNRGGRGMAGTGKRADSKKPSIWKERYFGKRGFESIQRKRIEAKNIADIEKNIEKLLAEKTISKEGEHYIVDSRKLKFNKLLGKGNISHKFRIDVPYASKRAIEAVKKAGGSVSCEESKKGE